MESYINRFLKTELTVIPELLNSYFGKYYNNALCNGVTWMLAVWCVLHLIFDDVLNGLLQRMRYKEYVRLRIQCSLWYLGFYSTACIYCMATLARNGLKLFDLEETFNSINTTVGHLILGFIVMLSFYLHSALWEGLKYYNGKLACSYLCLFLLFCFSYLLGCVEGIFRLTIFICATQFVLELARCIILMGRGNIYRKFMITVAFVASIAVFVVNYIILVPFLFGYPFIKKISPSQASILLACLIIWLIIEIFSSVLFKTMSHWINHMINDKNTCGQDIIECSLFPPRFDDIYNFSILRKEMIERQERSMSLRKPKNRNVVFQTLKCMVAIKRKLHEKRQDTCKAEKDTTEMSVDHIEERNVSKENSFENFASQDDSIVEDIAEAKAEFSNNESYNNKSKRD